SVYLAEMTEEAPDLRVGDLVALKIIHLHLMEGGRFRARLRREVEMGMSVRHPNVVRTHGYHVHTEGDEALHVICMEYVEGQTLRQFLEEEGRCDEPLCHHVGREIASGLAAIHEAEIIHRDVKPENVMITKDEVVKLMDLGMARLKDEAFRLSNPGDFVGTPLYSAPEQFLRGGEEVDGRADLYTLGLVLYELITGVHALGGGGAPGAVMRRQIRTAPPPPSRRNPQISPFFEELILTLLQKDRSERIDSAATLKDVLSEREESAWWRTHSESRRGRQRRRRARIRVPRETALYGRDTELEALRRGWEHTRAGNGQVVLIEGEAGIGKTRLVDEFVTAIGQEHPDLNFLYGAYPPGGAATASGAISTALREFFGVERLEESLLRHLKSTPGLAPRLAAWLRGEPLPGAGRLFEKDPLETLEGLFARLLRSIATDGPTVLCVDDLQFAPLEARAIFASLSHSLAPAPVFLIATFRPELPRDWLATVERVPHVSRIRLGRLGARDLQLLLTDALLSERSAEQLGGVVAVKSDGNPFFVFEILRSLKERRIVTLGEQGSWDRTGEVRDLVIPDSMKDLTRARIAELSETDRELLDVAACCGVTFDPVLVGEVLSLGRIPTLKRFTQLQRKHRLVHARGREFVFDHYQLREALYESLSELLREEYHAAIAETLIRREGGH
ncbi:MAG: serine/threonine-protein kinase, partial [Planctomycetota bacterium]